MSKPPPLSMMSDKASSEVGISRLGCYDCLDGLVDLSFVA